MMKKIQFLILIYLTLIVIAACSSLYAANEISGWSGDFYTELYYSPETFWKAGSRLLFNHEMNVGSGGEVFLSLGGWLPSFFELTPYTSNDRLYADLSLRRLSATVKTELFNQGPSFELRIGDLDLNYSPLIAKFDNYDIWRSPSEQRNPGELITWNIPKRGLSFGNLAFGPLNSQGFVIWESHPSDFALGYNGKLNFGHFRLGITSVTLRGKDINDNYLNKDKTLGLNIEMPTNILGINLDTVFHQKEDGPIRLAINAKIALENNLFFDYWRIEKGFDPNYRDKTPKYDPKTGEKLSWNPVDKYQDQHGYLLSYGFRGENFNLIMNYGRLNGTTLMDLTETYNAEYEIYKNNKRVIVRYQNEIKGSPVNQFGLRNKTISSHLYCKANNEIKTRNGSANMGIVIEEKNYNEYYKDQNLFVKARPSKGLFAGVEGLIKIGKRNMAQYKGRYFTFGFNHVLAGGVNIKLRNTSPKIHRSYALGGLYYDKDGDLVELDNIFLVTYQLKF